MNRKRTPSGAFRSTNELQVLFKLLSGIKGARVLVLSHLFIVGSFVGFCAWCIVTALTLDGILSIIF
jgi:hypothetical protein